MHNASMMKSVVKIYVLNVLMMNGRDLMPTGYLVVNGVEVTRREYLAWEKEQLDMPMDHFDKRALKRYYEKMKNFEKSNND